MMREVGWRRVVAREGQVVVGTGRWTGSSSSTEAGEAEERRLGEVGVRGGEGMGPGLLPCQGWRSCQALWPSRGSSPLTMTCEVIAGGSSYVAGAL